jgi:ubiquitin-protein ligase
VSCCGVPCRAAFPEQYPTVAPTLTFKTPIFHPNVGEKGEVCNALLLVPPPVAGAGRGGLVPPSDSAVGTWSIAVSMGDVLRNLQHLLAHPVVEHPMNIVAADLFQTNHSEFVRMATALRGGTASAAAAVS